MLDKAAFTIFAVGVFTTAVGALLKFVEIVIEMWSKP